MGRLRLQLLGAFVLHGADGAPVALPTRKTQALLAVLACARGRPYGRDAAATLLWGDAPEARARQSLRQALAFLRQALHGAGAGLAGDGHALAIDPQAIEVDVARFEPLAQRTDADALRQAVELYRGDLLAGLELDEPGFQEWLETERRRLRELAAKAMSGLLALQEPAAPAQALATAECLLALDPLQEDAHRAVMRLLWQLGRRGAALRQYQVCAELLQRELQVGPETATQALYRRMLLQERSEQAEDAAPAPGPQPGARRLIGRQSVLRTLDRALDAAWSGRGGIVLLSGEAGIGKTRLIEELIGAARRRGGRVLSGRCFESERILPFHGWTDALRSAGIPAESDLLDRLDAASRGELARILPELGAPPGEAPRRPHGHLRLFQVLANLLAELARDQPVLLVLDDLHWADEMTARLVAYVGRRIEAQRLLLLASRREEETPLASALDTALDELARTDALRRIELAPLSRNATADLIAAHAGPSVDVGRLRALEAEIWRASEGNPFVVVECMRALDGRAGSLPRSVRDATRARLRRLGPNARRMASLAAAIGREAEFPVLLRASGLAREAGAEAIEELVRRRVLESERDAFRFVHARVREVIYTDLLPPRRALLHAAILAALEAEHAGRLHRAHDLLAHHAAAARDDARALRYLVGLAADAAQRYALDDAIRMLDAALGHAERLTPPQGDRAAVEVLFRLTDNLIFVGQPRLALTRLEAQAARVARLDDASLRAQYHFWLAQAASFLDAAELTEQHAMRCITLAEPLDDRPLCGKAHCLIARARGLRDDPERGLHHAHQAIALLDTAAEPSWLGHSHWQVAVSSSWLGQGAETLAAGLRARELGLACGDLRLQTCAGWAISWGHIGLLQAEASIAAAQAALEIAPDPLHRAASQVYLGSALVNGNRNAEAVAMLEDALPVLRRSDGVRYLLSHGGLSLAACYLAEGRLELAEATAREAVEQGRISGWQLGFGWAERVLGEIARAGGRLGAAEAHFRRAAEILAAADARSLLAVTEMMLADVIFRRGAPDQAALILAQTRDRLAAQGLTQLAQRAGGLAGRLARSSG